MIFAPLGRAFSFPFRADGLTGLLISLEGEASEVVEIVELGDKTAKQQAPRRSVRVHGVAEVQTSTPNLRGEVFPGPMTEH